MRGLRWSALLLALSLTVVLGATFAATPASAVPDLQIYIEGATYDTTTQTWVIHSSDFYVDVIGKGSLTDVNLVAALVPATTSTSSGTVTMTPVGFSAGAQTGWTTGTPVMADGHDLPGHGIYPAPYTRLPMGDFAPIETIYNMPDVSDSALGQLKRVHVVITGFETVHFDAYNHVVGATNGAYSKFNPPSHDGEGGDGDVPEPASVLLMLSGLGGLALFKRGRSR